MAYIKNGLLFIPRTELTFPGINTRDPLNNPTRMLQNFARSEADLGMADMEDACPHDYKGEPVRNAIVKGFHEIDFGVTKVITFRPNNWQTELHKDDLTSVIKGAPNRFDGLILPKIFRPENFEVSLQIVYDAAQKSGWNEVPRIEILIETPTALRYINELCEVGLEGKYGSPLVGLIFGIADYAAANSQPDALHDQNLNYLVAKQMVIYTAHAYGLHAIDNVWLRLNERPPTEADWKNRYLNASGLEEATKLHEAVVRENNEAFSQKNRQVALWGMDGTWVIHPEQIRMANQAFTPTDEQIENAEKVVEEYFRQGGGAIVSTAKGTGMEMGDTATMNIALSQLARGVQTGKYDMAKYNAFAEQAAKVIGFSYQVVTSPR